MLHSCIQYMTENNIYWEYHPFNLENTVADKVVVE